MGPLSSLAGSQALWLARKTLESRGVPTSPTRRRLPAQECSKQGGSPPRKRLFHEKGGALLKNSVRYTPGRARHVQPCAANSVYIEQAAFSACSDGHWEPGDNEPSTGKVSTGGPGARVRNTRARKELSRQGRCGVANRNTATGTGARGPVARSPLSPYRRAVARPAPTSPRGLPRVCLHGGDNLPRALRQLACGPRPSKGGPCR